MKKRSVLRKYMGNNNTKCYSKMGRQKLGHTFASKVSKKQTELESWRVGVPMQSKEFRKHRTSIAK